MDLDALKAFFVELIAEEFNPKPAEIEPRWQGGTLRLIPGNDSQPKDVPIEVFYKKITGIRESLRVLEQKLNNHDKLSTEEKANFQSYITKCYGSMTTFNILFKQNKDRFVGAGKAPKEDAQKMSMSDVKRKLGLNEYGRD